MPLSPKNTKRALVVGALLALAVAAIFANAVGPVSKLAPATLAAVEAPATTGTPKPAGLPSTSPIPGGAHPFPIKIDLAFSLIDQNGGQVTELDFRGRPMLLFFGYSHCESICTVALPNIGKALDALGAEGDEIAAVMVTIDPARDTPEAMRKNLPRWHERLQGLTGPPDALAEIRDLFHVDLKTVAEDPSGAPIYAHGSFVYLIDANGELATMVPPILGPERIAELARKFF